MTLILAGSFSVGIYSQEDLFLHSYFVNMDVHSSTTGMADGMIVLELVGDYPGSVEFRFVDVTDTEFITDDTLAGIDFYSQVFFNIFTVDVGNGDTIAKTYIEVLPEHNFTLTLNSVIPGVDFSNDGFLSADFSVETNMFSYLNLVYSGDYIVWDCLPQMTLGIIPIDSIYITQAWSGFYAVNFQTDSTTVCTTFKIGNIYSGLANLEVFSTPSSVDSCDGTAMINLIQGGTPPYNYYWDGLVGGQQNNALCAGVHMAMVVDNAGDTVQVIFGIADSLHFIDNSSLFSSYTDTIYFQTQDCSIDLSIPVDSVEIVNVTFPSDSMAKLTFILWQMGLPSYVEDSAQFTPPISGNVLVDLTSFCLSKSSFGNVFKYRAGVNYLGTPEYEQNHFSIYPNPANDFVNIEGKGYQKICITDMSGRICLTSDKSQIDISNLDQGVYLVFILDSGNVILNSERLIIAR